MMRDSDIHMTDTATTAEAQPCSCCYTVCRTALRVPSHCITTTKATDMLVNCRCGGSHLPGNRAFCIIANSIPAYRWVRCECKHVGNAHKGLRDCNLCECFAFRPIVQQGVTVTE